MFDVNTFLQMLSVGLLFVLLKTRVWKKSPSASIYVVSLVVSLELFVYGQVQHGLIVIVCGAFIAVIEAMFSDRVCIDKKYKS